MSRIIIKLANITCCLIIMVIMMAPQAVIAADISVLKFTEFDSFLALRYLYDERSTITDGTTTKEEKFPTFQEEFGVEAPGYVYHPNLLNFDLGGSLLFDQSEFESLNGESSANSDLLNYFAHLDFLEKKPYPFSVFYDQQHPSVSLGLAGRYIQENIKYGYNFSLLQPFSPVQITAGAFRQTSKGESTDQVVDDVLEQANMRMYHAYGAGNNLQLSYQLNRNDSRSGSPNLTIEPRIFETESSQLSSKNIFGSDGQFRLTSLLVYNTQDQFPVREDWKFDPNLSWRHSETVNSFYRFNYTKSSEELINTELMSINMGVAKTGEDANGSMNVHAEDQEVTDFESQAAGADYSITYRVPILSDVKFTYGGAYERNDQQAVVNQLQVFDEEHILVGTTAVNLAQDFIDINSIVVSNESRTQVFIENEDYRIIVIGSRTQLQRLTGGNILDGQLVLVDYTYETGGTFSSDAFNQNVAIIYSPSRFYEFYTRYFYFRQELLEGDPTVPLNSINRAIVGATADKPLSNGMVIGGEVSFENNNEEITPYVKESADAYMDLPLPKLTNMRLSVRRVQVDNENSDEDVDLYGGLMRIRSRPWLRTSLVLESNYENDEGGSVDRLWLQHRMQLGWRIRQLNVSFDALYSEETQGNTERDRWSVNFTAVRKF